MHDLVPVRGKEHSQTGVGSNTFLELHVEDAYLGDARCGYLALLCLRGGEAKTVVAPVGALELTERCESVLRSKRFVAYEDLPETERTLHHAVPVAVLAGPRHDPRITLDPLYMSARNPDDLEAVEALKIITEQISVCTLQYALQTGDLLIIDNLRALHGRTSFSPRYDGSDRWLQRVLAGVSPQQILSRDEQSPVIRCRPFASTVASPLP